MGELSSCSIDNLYPDAGATFGLERILFQVLRGKVDRVWAALIGILTA